MAVNYDPVKAHEYYVNYTKKGLTKGRRSTKGFSQTQKEQWAYAKHQLSEEHKAINKSITESGKEKRSALSADCKDKVAQLRERVKSASKEQKAMIREQVNAMVADLRSQLKLDKEKVSASTKAGRESEKTAYEKRKDQAYETIKGSKKTASSSKKAKKK